MRLARTGHAAIAAASNGNNTIVTAIAGKIIRVTSYTLVAAGTVAVKWRSNDTDLSGAMTLVVNNVVPVGFNPDGHVQTAAGEALKLNNSAGVAVNGHVSYAVLDPVDVG